MSYYNNICYICRRSSSTCRCDVTRRWRDKKPEKKPTLTYEDWRVIAIATSLVGGAVLVGVVLGEIVVRVTP